MPDILDDLEYSRDNLPAGMTVEEWDFFMGEEWPDRVRDLPKIPLKINRISDG